MMELLWPSFCGGVIVGLWIIARARRKAVARLVDRLLATQEPDDVPVCRKVLDDVKVAGWRSGWSADVPMQDAAGRMIERCVKRLTKGKP